MTQNKNKVTIADLINSQVTGIKIWNQAKRITTPTGDRDFAVRVCWRAYKGEKCLESKWEGFDTAEDAINDLIEKCS